MTINDIQEGIMSNYIRHAGRISNRKSLVGWQWQCHTGILAQTSTCGSLPTPIFLAWERSQPLVPMGGGMSCPCTAQPSQTRAGPHALSELKILGPACLCSRAQKKGYTYKIISKSCFCWRRENLETSNSRRSPIKIQDQPFVH